MDVNGKICSVLEAMGYKVNNRNGKENRVLNLMDLTVFAAYVVLSIYNLCLNVPSNVGLGINSMMLARLLLKNSIEMRKATKSKKYYGNFIMVYIIKMVVEAGVILNIVAVNIICAIASVSANGPTFMYIYFGVILFVTSLENILAFLERIYDAEPRVIQYAE